MRIGIDLDDVVFEFVNELLKHFEEKYRKKISYEEIISYHFYNILGISKEDFEKLFFNHFDKEKMENLDLCELAYESVNNLSKEHDIFFITSRVRKEGTLESLKKHFNHINFKLHFSSNPYAGTLGKNKGEICKELEIDFMIEDSKEHAEICAKQGIKTFLLDKPWNRYCEEHDKIIKVRDWSEVLNKINGDLNE